MVSQTHLKQQFFFLFVIHQCNFKSGWKIQCPWDETQEKTGQDEKVVLTQRIIDSATIWKCGYFVCQELFCFFSDSRDRVVLTYVLFFRDKKDRNVHQDEGLSTFHSRVQTATCTDNSFFSSEDGVRLNCDCASWTPPTWRVNGKHGRAAALTFRTRESPPLPSGGEMRK